MLFRSFKWDQTITKELRLDYQKFLKSGTVKEDPLSFEFNAVPVVQDIPVNEKCQVVVWVVWLPEIPPTPPGSPAPPPPTQQVEFGNLVIVRKPSTP